MPRVFLHNVCKMRLIHIEKNKITEKFDDTGKPTIPSFSKMTWSENMKCDGIVKKRKTETMRGKVSVFISTIFR